MTIYRVAWKRNDTSLWQWKSTKLPSLHAVLGFQRLYHTIPAERMRVFSAASLEELDRQLGQANECEALLIAELVQQKLQAEEITRPNGTGETLQETSETRQNRQQVFATRPTSSRNENNTYAATLYESMAWLERRRLEHELGAAGDHDIPYTFALPDSLPQCMALTRLLGRVQRGELEP